MSEKDSKSKRASWLGDITECMSSSYASQVPSQKEKKQDKKETGLTTEKADIVITDEDWQTMLN